MYQSEMHHNKINIVNENRILFTAGIEFIVVNVQYTHTDNRESGEFFRFYTDQYLIFIPLDSFVLSNILLQIIVGYRLARSSLLMTGTISSFFLVEG